MRRLWPKYIHLRFFKTSVTMGWFVFKLQPHSFMMNGETLSTPYAPPMAQEDLRSKVRKAMPVYKIQTTSKMRNYLIQTLTKLLALVRMSIYQLRKVQVRVAEVRNNFTEKARESKKCRTKRKTPVVKTNSDELDEGLLQSKKNFQEYFLHSEVQKTIKKSDARRKTNIDKAKSKSPFIDKEYSTNSKRKGFEDKKYKGTKQNRSKYWPGQIEDPFDR